MRKKPNPIKKSNTINSNKTREQFAKEPRTRDHSVDSGSTLANFAKQHFDVGLSCNLSSDNDNKKPSGKGDAKSSGKGFASKRDNRKPAFEPFFDCYGMDVAPLNLFENQVIPVRIHNISKSFKPNLDTIQVFSLGTKFIPKWRKLKQHICLNGLMISKIN